MSSIVPGYDTDVFISYSHIDNRAVGGIGWVNDFQARLENRLSVLLGCEASVWHDERLEPADIVTPELRTRLRRSVVLVAIMSPAYAGSKWCEWELKGFIQEARRGLTSGNKSRAIKVVKLPGDDDHYSRILPDVKDVVFFARRGGHAIELAPTSESYSDAMQALACSIANILNRLKKQRTVYMPAAPPSLKGQRDKLLQELAAHQYRVLSPASDSPADDGDVRAAIAQSGVHLFFVDSDDPLTRGPATVESAPIDDVAAAHQVVVVHSASQAGNSFWKELPKSQESSPTEVLVNPETTALKNAVMQTLNTPPESVNTDAMVRVYLICHQDDHPLIRANRARALRDYLRSLRIEVKLPLAEKDEDVQFSSDNRAKLKTCDAVILYWGESRQGWFEQRLMELRKARGWRKDRPFTVTAGYVADPTSIIKSNFETREVDLLIKQFESLDASDERLRTFLARLPAAGV
ncbi:MAG TPA: toll/interleukin-1 receptor domain-containing protein [Vicinamibacterales bacterium]|nr:toll/interleukin-1 receptor domain-containing protein [Vicinamibacterales bacterium]